MFITDFLTMNYNEKCKLDTWSKQTQTNPILPAVALSAYGGFRNFAFLTLIFAFLNA